MCGIMGYAGAENSVPFIMDGLKKLEYRGYDSSGIAVTHNGKINIVKQKGRISALEDKLKITPLNGSTGIGHTRWATHGKPSDVNSHPHVGSKNKIAIVHNGIIENYAQLKEMLIEKGVSFASQTDSEVIAQLAEYYYTGNIVETVIALTKILKGSYALGVMCADEPEKIVAVKRDNPLILGECENANFIASDVPAVLKYTSKVYYLNDNEIAVLTKEKIEFYDLTGKVLGRQPETILWSMESAEKGGYSHFMLKEIVEQPKVVGDTIKSVAEGQNKKVLEELNIENYSKIVITACGSAYNAGMVAKYVFDELARLSVEVELASEFRYKNPIVDENTLVVLVSQSGETADTIAALREARRKGAKTLAVVNVVGSTIAKEADYSLYTVAGPEIAVATTKAFSAQLVMLYLAALEFAKKLGRITPEEYASFIKELYTLPCKIQNILDQKEKIKAYAMHCTNYKNIFFIGRNTDYAISLEGSLKLKEISYMNSEAYAGGELKHGTISLVDDATLVVACACHKALYPKIASNAEQVISRGANVLFVGNCVTMPQQGKVNRIDIPQIAELFSPSLAVIVLQLLSYYIADAKGCDVDKPRNLAKSVTVE